MCNKAPPVIYVSLGFIMRFGTLVFLLGVVAFPGLLLLVANVLIAERRSKPRFRIAIQGFIVYMLLASCAAGFLHTDLPPFARYNVFAQIMTVPTYAIRIRAVDALAREYDVDARVWEPQSAPELVTWLDFDLPVIPIQSQDRVGQYLLNQTNTARLRLLAGRPIGVFDRYLGPLTAPEHVMFKKYWRSSADVPPGPFKRIKVYREWWDQHKRAVDPNSYRFDLVYEYPRS